MTHKYSKDEAERFARVRDCYRKAHLEYFSVNQESDVKVPSLLDIRVRQTQVQKAQHKEKVFFLRSAVNEEDFSFDEYSKKLNNRHEGVIKLAIKAICDYQTERSERANGYGNGKPEDLTNCVCEELKSFLKDLVSVNQDEEKIKHVKKYCFYIQMLQDNNIFPKGFRGLFSKTTMYNTLGIVNRYLQSGFLAQKKVAQEEKRQRHTLS